MVQAHEQSYSLQEFVADLRRVAGTSDEPGHIVRELKPLAQRLALDKSWVEERFYRPNDEQGFSATLLHEEPDHSLAVLAASWLPGRGAPPHDHGTWAVVAGVDGPEKNSFWKRVDDGSRPGYAEIVKTAEKVFSEGHVLTMLPGAIHSVDNESDQITLSLHVYGRHVNHTERSTFDPETKVEKPFKVAME